MSEDGTYIAWDNHKSNRYFVKEESIYECNRIAYQFITSINNKTKTIKLNKKDGKWSEFLTWHHHENGTDLIPVPTSLHYGLPHVGGVETVGRGINHLFNY